MVYNKSPQNDDQIVKEFNNLAYNIKKSSQCQIAKLNNFYISQHNVEFDHGSLLRNAEMYDIPLVQLLNSNILYIAIKYLVNQIITKECWSHSSL